MQSCPFRRRVRVSDNTSGTFPRTIISRTLRQSTSCNKSETRWVQWLVKCLTSEAEETLEIMLKKKQKWMRKCVGEKERERGKDGWRREGEWEGHNDGERAVRKRLGGREGGRKKGKERGREGQRKRERESKATNCKLVCEAVSDPNPYLITIADLVQLQSLTPDTISIIMKLHYILPALPKVMYSCDTINSSLALVRHSRMKTDVYMHNNTHTHITCTNTYYAYANTCMYARYTLILLTLHHSKVGLLLFCSSH